MDEWKTVLAALCGVALCIGAAGHCIKSNREQILDYKIRSKMIEAGQYNEALRNGS